MAQKSGSDTLTTKKGFNWRVSEPRSFSGVSVAGEDLGNVAYTWLKKMERLKVSAKLTDDEVLFLVSDHLVQKAETWFNVIGVKANSWEEFTTLFKKQYLADQEDKWWSQLQNMKQGEGDSIDDVALKMEELFELLENKSDAFQIRTFLSAIRSDIGFEVEKDGTPSSFEGVKIKAKQVEKSLLKYNFSGRTAVSEKGFRYKPEPLIRSNFSDVSSVANSDIHSLVAKLEQLSINLVRLNEGAAQGQSKPFVPYNSNNGNNSARPVFTCFYCREVGHKKYDCPKFLCDQGQAPASNPATGSNSIPLEVQLVDTVIEGAKEILANEILTNGVKRRAMAPPSVEAMAGSASRKVVNSGFQKQVKRKTRNKARRYPVKLKRSKIWSKLLETEAGISMAEWLSLDKEAAAEIIDGIRYLRESKVVAKNKAVGVTDKVIAGLKDLPGTSAPMEVNEVDIDDDFSSLDSGEDYGVDSSGSCGDLL
ncbi:hypothetical protein INT47_005964 [Mucor saturninus]|uniref:CCHC-type domain-containing protein n=1 Tax=Mucor saturninus TaxID=64648 RepID=A0A8H7QF22_9FUNG|nr:hypothetical protein INT47_005964 [Mucor saturninus]